MDLINTSSGVKRRVGEKVENEASTSKKILITNSAVGAVVNAQGNSRVSIDNIVVNHHIHQQQTKPQKPLRDITLQLADPVDTFRGRDKQLQHVKHVFCEQKHNKYNLVAVCGYGGIGKTEFARKYIQQNRADFENIMWIYAEFEYTMQASFNKLQEEIKNSGYPCTDHQFVYKYLNNAKCLFVFDNAESMKTILPFLPDKSNDSLFLITSQYRTWNPYESVLLDKLDLESATKIIKAVLDIHDIEINQNQLKELVNKFEPIPLVLQIVAGFVCEEVLELKSIEKEYNIDDIIEVLNTECELVTQEFPSFFQDLYAKSVFEALSRTLDKIWTKQDKVSKLAAKMLGISAHLSPDYIKENILKDLLKIENTNLFHKSLASLVQFSLFKISYNIIIHRTVQECVIHYCRQKLKTNEYFLQSLHVLLIDHHDYWNHHKMVLQRVEDCLETFWTFYDANKCRAIYQNMAKFISCQTLQLLVVKFDLIRNPEFLCEAAASERGDVVQVLRDNSADYNYKDNNGFNPLYFACLPRDKDEDYDYYMHSTLSITWKRIQALINNNADVNLPNSDGNTIMHILCNLGKTCVQKDEYIFELCVLMIKVGGDPKIKNKAAQAPVDLAREYELKLTCELLDAVTSGNQYILHLVAEYRQYEFLGFLTRDKVYDINQQDDAGRTIFHMLAALTQLDTETENNLLYSTAALLDYCDAYIDVSIVNNSGETAMVVAKQHKRDKLADVFNAWIDPSRNIYSTESLEHFPFVRSKNKWQVNEQDDSGSTLLHAICGLETYNDSDIVKLASHLVIWAHTDVHIKNKAGDTAADVALRNNRKLLADFLHLRVTADDSWRCNCCRKTDGVDLVYVAIKHKQFELVKFAWWRYCYFNSETHVEGFPDASGCAVLHMLCGYDDPEVTDEELIRVIEDLDLKLVAEYDEFSYHEAVGIAKQHGRDGLTTISICDINAQDNSGCTELHRLSDDPNQNAEAAARTFNRIVNLVTNCDADVSIVNNAGETAADVARTHGHEKLEDFLNARAEPGRSIYATAAHHSQIEHFSYVNSKDKEHVNEQDDTGCTLLHALCDLDDTQLELDIVKLIAHLVIDCDADEHIMNNAGDSPADVARRRNHLLLADFLDKGDDEDGLVYVAMQHRQFELVKYVWWRYFYCSSFQEMYGSPDAPGCRMLLILCEFEDQKETDLDLSGLYDYLDMQQVADYFNKK